MIKRLESPAIADVRLCDGVLAQRRKTAVSSTIPSAIRKAEESGRINAFDLENYKGLREYFYDSDTAKILEGIAYALQLEKNDELQKTFET